MKMTGKTQDRLRCYFDFCNLLLKKTGRPLRRGFFLPVKVKRSGRDRPMPHE
jgi:hypothetical protein